MSANRRCADRHARASPEPADRIVRPFQADADACPGRPNALPGRGCDPPVRESSRSWRWGESPPGAHDPVFERCPDVGRKPAASGDKLSQMILVAGVERRLEDDPALFTFRPAHCAERLDAVDIDDELLARGRQIGSPDTCPRRRHIGENRRARTRKRRQHGHQWSCCPGRRSPAATYALTKLTHA